MFDLHRLSLLRELSHRGTLAAVARALNYSPSSVSQQLTQLEAETGVRLLEPVGRRVRLTAEALVLVEHTELILGQMEAAEAALASTHGSGRAATIKIASFQSAAIALLPQTLTRLNDTHPHLRIEVTVADAALSVPAVLARDFDLALVEEYPGQPHPVYPGTERRELMRDDLILAAPAAWGTVLTDLAHRPWAMEPEGGPARSWSSALCRSAGFEPDVRYTSTDLVMHVILANQGLAAALLPRLATVTPSLTATIAPLSGRPARRVFTTIRKGSRTNPAITALREALVTSKDDFNSRRTAKR